MFALDSTHCTLLHSIAVSSLRRVMPVCFRYPLTFFGKEWRGILLRSDMSVGDWLFVAEDGCRGAISNITVNGCEGVDLGFITSHGVFNI